MQPSEHNERVLAVASLREYFHDALQGALAHQHVAVEDQTEQYVVNLLTLFARSEQLYEHTPDGVRLRPLVQMLSDALEAPSAIERERGLNPAQRFHSARAQHFWHILQEGGIFGAVLRVIFHVGGEIMNFPVPRNCDMQWIELARDHHDAVFADFTVGTARIEILDGH